MEESDTSNVSVKMFVNMFCQKLSEEILLCLEYLPIFCSALAEDLWMEIQKLFHCIYRHGLNSGCIFSARNNFLYGLI